MVVIRKIVRIFIVLVVLSILAIIITLFWASSPNYSEDKYIQIIEGEFPDYNDGDSLYSIITYNIGYLSGLTNNRAVQSSEALFDKNLITVKKAIEEVDPDILCFQEIDFNSSRSFHINQQEEIRNLGYNYTFQAVNWDVSLYD